MARERRNGNGKLGEAVKSLVTAQASLIQAMAQYAAEKAESDRRHTELARITADRFAEVRAVLLEHSRILAKVTRILERLPDAVRERIRLMASSAQ